MPVKLRQYFIYKTNQVKCVVFPFTVISVCSSSVELSKAIIYSKCVVQATGVRSDLAEHQR